MLTLGPGSHATCKVFTRKEGLLAAIAHDLEIDVTRFEIRIEDDRSSIEATFDPSSLRVRGAMRDGVFVPGVIAESDLRKIEHTLTTEVLEARTCPTVRFRTRAIAPDGAGFRLDGDLELHGHTRPLTVRTVAGPDGVQTVRVPLTQPDFGIAPYRAMLGTLKVHPVVHVELRVSLTR